MSLGKTRSCFRLMEEMSVKPFERCAIINLLPGTAEEAKALIPSLEASSKIPDRTSFSANKLLF